MILVSSAVGSKELVDLPPLAGLAVKCDIDSADAVFAGNGPDGPVTVGVEIKRTEDLIASIVDGRLNGIDGQLRAMSTYDVKWLVRYGLTRANPHTGALQVGKLWAQKGHPSRLSLEWRDYGSDVKRGDAARKALSYGFVERFLASPAFAELGIAVKSCVDIDDVAQWLVELYGVWSKPYDQHKSLHTFHRPPEIKRPPTIKPATKRELQVAATAFTLPGLGYERSWALATKYGRDGGGGVRALINAGPRELAEVRVRDAKGRERRIGDVVANAVEEAIT